MGVSPPFHGVSSLALCLDSLVPETRFSTVGSARVASRNPKVVTRRSAQWALEVGRPESDHPVRWGVGDAASPGSGRERRFGNRRSMCPYKRPYNSGSFWIRLLPPPSAMATLTCELLPVEHSPAPSFPAYFRIPKPCAQVRILPGAPVRDQVGERGHDSGAAGNRRAPRHDGPGGEAPEGADD
jgi:hypothetical protein